MTCLITRILMTTALTFSVSFTAFASPAQASRMLDKMDANKDGLIQLAEFTAHGDQKFAQMDVDGNGFVTGAEKTAFRTEMRALRAESKFDALDTNGDGALSKTEFIAAQDARQQRKQARMDVNGDGVFDRADKQKMKAHKKKNKAMRKKMRQERQKNGGRTKPDANGDGMLNRAEHQAAMLARFARMDKNSDGVLAADEQRKPKGARGFRH